jgi:hypothetical protein
MRPDLPVRPEDHRDADRWEAAFVAVSAIAGEPPDAVASALGEGGMSRAADLVRALGATSKEARARALARAVSDVALAIDAMRYA